MAAALFPASRSEETASAMRRRGWCAPPRRRVLAKEEDEAPAGSGGALSPPDLAATGARNLEMEAICVTALADLRRLLENRNFRYGPFLL